MKTRKNRGIFNNSTLVNLLALAALLVFAPRLAAAEPNFVVVFDRFEDANNNGLLDCGEIVRWRVGVFENGLPPDTNYHGRIFIPYPIPTSWSFIWGTVQPDFVLTSRCTYNVLEGNGTSDVAAHVEYDCVSGNPPSDNYAASFFVSGYYTGNPVTRMQVTATLDQTLPTPFSTQKTVFHDGDELCARPDLGLAKADSGASAIPGSLISYTLNYSNLGPIAAPDTTLTETVPAHSVFSPLTSSPGWSCTPDQNPGATCTLVHGNLPSGAFSSKIFSVRADLPVPPGTTNISNTARIATSAPEEDLSNNTASDSTPLDPGHPDLALSKTVSSGSGQPGSIMVYTLSVRNNGLQTAAGTTLTESLPSYSSFDASSSSPGWSCVGSSCSLTIGALPPAGTFAATFALRIDSTLPADALTLTNQACVATSTPNDPPADNCASTTTPLAGSPNLSLTKSLASGTATPGSTLVFRLRLRNTGTRPAGSPSLSETIPENTTFSAASSSPGWTCAPTTAAGSTCTLTLPSLSPSDQAERLFAVNVNNPLPAGVTSIANTACASDPQATRTCDTIEIPTDASPSLSVAKTLLSGSPAPGQVVVYEVTVSNVGNQAASGVLLSETVPDHTSFEPSSSPGWSCTPDSSAGSSCSLTVGTLAGGGASTSRLFAVRLVNPLPAGVSAIRNTACASAPALNRTCDEEATPTTGSPRLTFQKVLTSPVTPGPGSILLYTLTVRNDGDQDAAGIELVEQIPPHTTFLASQSTPGWLCSPDIQPGSTCSLSVASLNVGESRSATFALQLPSPLPAGLETVANTACALLGSQNPCSTHTTPISGSPEIHVQKTYDGPPLAPGALLVFHLAVSNVGDQNAIDLVVTETVPAHSTPSLPDSSPGWTCSATTPGSACAFHLTALNVGSVADIAFAVRADNPLPQGLTSLANSACVSLADQSGSTCDEASTPLPTTVELFLADSVETDANSDGLINSGDILRYRLTLTNSPDSQQSAQALVVALTLDSHLRLNVGSATTDVGDVTAGNTAGDTSPLFFIPALAPGQTATLSFTVVISDVPPELDHLSSTGLVSGANIDAEPSDDPDTPTDDDPTLTPLGQPSQIRDIPTLDTIGLLLLAVSFVLFALRQIRA
jgi:large repetitive protein